MAPAAVTPPPVEAEALITPPPEPAVEMPGAPTLESRPACAEPPGSPAAPPQTAPVETSAEPPQALASRFGPGEVSRRESLGRARDEDEGEVDEDEDEIGGIGGEFNHHDDELDGDTRDSSDDGTARLDTGEADDEKTSTSDDERWW